MHALKTRLPPKSIISQCWQFALLPLPLRPTQARRWLATDASPDKTATTASVIVNEAMVPIAKRKLPKGGRVASSTTKSAKKQTAIISTTTAIKKTKKPVVEILKDPATKLTRRRTPALNKPVTLKSIKLSKPKSTATTRRSPASKNLLQHQQHYDFNSYLQFLETTGKSTSTTVSTGTLYEYATIKALANLGFRDLVRCGKAGDNGVDVIGTCDASAVARTLLNSPRATGTTPRGRKPQLLQHVQTVFQALSRSDEAVAARDREIGVLATPPARPFNVIVQCKASEASVGSYLMREMAGSYFAFTNTALELRTAPVAAPTMVILVTAGGRLTSGAYKQLEASQMPMVYMYLEKPRCTGGATKKYDPKSYRLGGISQVTPNQYAKELLKQHGLAFKIVRSYSLKPSVIVDQVDS